MVIARLKIKVPGLMVTHCSVHRLALAASAAARLTPWFKHFVNQVYSFFSHSTVCIAELAEMQWVMDHPPLAKAQKAF